MKEEDLPWCLCNYRWYKILFRNNPLLINSYYWFGWIDPEAWLEWWHFGAPIRFYYWKREKWIDLPFTERRSQKMWDEADIVTLYKDTKAFKKLLPDLDFSDPDTIYLGDGHIVRLMYTDETETEVSSVILMHHHSYEPGEICQGYAEIGKGEWKINKREPLSMSPSFICDVCKDHGVIENGKWRSTGGPPPMKTTDLVKYMRGQPTYGIPRLLFEQASDRLEELDSKLKSIKKAFEDK